MVIANSLHSIQFQANAFDSVFRIWFIVEYMYVSSFNVHLTKNRRQMFNVSEISDSMPKNPEVCTEFG